MRLLPALALAQILGILLADRWPLDATACHALGGVLLLASLGVRRRRLREGMLAVAAACLGAASLAMRLEQAGHAPEGPEARVIEATLAGIAWQGDRSRSEWVGLAALDGAGPLPARIRLHAELSEAVPRALQTPHVGERWRLRVRLRRPDPPRNPGAPDRARALERRGIAATGRLVHPGLAVRIGGAGEGPDGALRRAREARAERLARLGPGGPLLATLGLGERRFLAEDVRTAFAQLGLAHLLAVSGLHLSLVAGVGLGAARLGLAALPGFAARHDARRFAVPIALAAAGLYAFASGFGLPARRAALLLAAVGLALATRRPRRRAAPLALASLLLLARAPHDLFEPGYQLSFAATAALLAARGRAGAASPHRIAEALHSLVRASATALLATAPLAAWHFGGSAPAALVANAIAIPATACGLLPLAVGSALLAGFHGRVAGALLAGAERLAAGGLEAASALAGVLPGGAPAAAASLPWGVALLAACLAVAGARVRATRWRLLALGLQTGLLAFTPPAALEPAPPRLVVLDVGQGDAIVVQGREGVLLMDAGRRLPGGYDLGERIVVPALAALGIERIDRVAVSHADLDHRGGVPAVLDRFEVGAVWLPAGGRAEPDFAALRAAAARGGVPVLERSARDAPEALGDLRVEFLGPAETPANPDRNDGSLVLRVSLGGGTVLLPGDVGAAGERALLERPGRLAADVLVLPHHGSRSSSGAAFLAAVAPRLAIVSAPCRGPFPMPHPDVRARVAAAGAALHWTGRDGAALLGLGRERGGARRWARRPGCFGER